MAWKDRLSATHQKVVADAGNKAQEILTQYIPKIRAVFTDKIGPAVLANVKDDETIAELSKLVYGLLPVMLRLAVKEERFVRFCLANRDTLVGVAESAKVANRSEGS